MGAKEKSSLLEILVKDSHIVHCDYPRWNKAVCRVLVVLDLNVFFVFQRFRWYSITITYQCGIKMIISCIWASLTCLRRNQWKGSTSCTCTIFTQFFRSNGITFYHSWTFLRFYKRGVHYRYQWFVKCITLNGVSCMHIRQCSNSFRQNPSQCKVMSSFNAVPGIINMWKRGSAARRKGKPPGERQGLWSL